MHLSRIPTSSLFVVLLVTILACDLVLCRKPSPRVKLKRKIWWKDRAETLAVKYSSEVETNNSSSSIRSADSDTGIRVTATRPAACVAGKRPLLRLANTKWKMVRSPGHPAAYYNNARCAWRIRAPIGRRVLVEFLSMDIEHEATQCKYDGLTVYDGKTPTRPRLMRHCGMDLPPRFISSARFSLWLFTSDRSVVQKGFRFRFRAIKRAPMKKCPSSPVQLTESSGTFASPNFYTYGRYNNGYNCRWLITVAEGRAVRITFHTLQLEEVNDCKADKVNIYDGGGDGAPLRASLCRVSPGTQMTSSANRMYVTFITDAELVSKGFNASYASVEIVSPTDVCGIPAIRPSLSRIVGGTISYRNSWPWMLSLTFSGHNWQHWCGACLLSPEWGITAAHCFYDREGNYQQNYNFNVIAGDHNKDAYDPTETEHEIAEVIRHEGYQYGVNDYDLAVFRFVDAVELKAETSPICLTDRAPRDVTTTCMVIGWGETQSLSESNSELRQVPLPLINTTVCQDWYGERVRDGMVCAGYEEGRRDACNGDSGGPLMCPDEVADNMFYLQGVTSWGIGCAAAKQPGVYTNIYHYREWIRQKTGI